MLIAVVVAPGRGRGEKESNIFDEMGRENGNGL